MVTTHTSESLSGCNGIILSSHIEFTHGISKREFPS